MGKEQELRPCPHCGMPVTLQTSKTLGDRLFVIACPNNSPCANSGLGTYVVAGKRDEAIAAWNRRSSSDEQAEVVGDQRKKIAHAALDLAIHEPVTERQMAQNSGICTVANMVRDWPTPLYASPVAMGGVTEAQVEAAMSAYWDTVPGNRRTPRDRMVDALLAALSPPGKGDGQ